MQPQTARFTFENFFVKEKNSEDPEFNGWLVKLARFCAFRERSKREVEEKMQSLFVSDDAWEKLIDALISEGYLNESRYCSAYARGKFRIKKWGKNKIRAGLKKEGMKKEQVEQAIQQEISETEYFLTATKLAEKKIATLKEKEPFILNQKVKLFLLQKGYEAELIRKVTEKNSD